MRPQPLFDRIVVRRDIAAPRAGGLVIVQDEPLTTGEVLAVGAEATINVGDRVVFGTDVGTQVEIERNPVLVMRECDILAVME